MRKSIAPPAPASISISSLSQARRHKRSFGAVLTLEDPKARKPDQLRFTHAPHPPHLVIAFEDADREDYGYATATRDEVAEAIEFGRTHAAGSLLVHCFHGVGRSAAIALSILTDRAGPGSEADAMVQLLEQRPHATPNLIVVAHADAILERNGALIAAVQASEAADRAKIDARLQRHHYAIDHPSLYAKRDQASA